MKKPLTQRIRELESHGVIPPFVADKLAKPESRSDREGWTPLEFYAYIVRTLGLPARFHFDGQEWVGEAPFTKPVPQSILDLLEAQGV